MKTPELGAAKTLERQWFFSFVDPARPEEEQFLGACIVSPTLDGWREADRRFEELGRTPTPDQRHFAAALETARLIGCNPGGAAQGVLISADIKIGPAFTGRLLSREEAEAAGEGQGQ